MTWQATLAIYGAVLLGCLLGGVSIGAAMGFVAVLGVTLVSGMTLWQTFGDSIWNILNTFTLVSIPLFVLMGEIILRSGISRRFFAGTATLFAGVPGGLAHTSVVGSAVFSAIAGSTVATALTIGTVALPEMRRRGYSDQLTLGCIAGGGCLGILIPPSIPMIVYASIVQESVIDLFMAGVVPGLLLAAIFMAYVAVRVGLQPGLAPPRERWSLAPATLGRAVADTAPVVALILSIIGGMYLGLVTPTEAAGFGCLVALAIGLAYRALTWSALGEALRSAVVSSAVMMFIVVNAQILSFAVVQSGIGRGVSDALLALGVDRFLFFTLLVLLYLVLGMFIDGLSMILLTLPILYPGIKAMGFDGIWVGVVLVVMIELGALTPPMGLNLFAIQSISRETPLGAIARSALPFAALILAFAYLLFAVPGLVLWLPQAMKG
ncbi:MAG: TRAP transporter large permease [Alphaproteobacteria bacterium]|nr:TRAP transporter large permease [Alphaproteobacteria bacterium]